MERIFIPIGGQIGILGGGQLGRMFIESGVAPSGRKAAVHDKVRSCGHEIANRQSVSPFDDQEQLQCFINNSDVITIETENLNFDMLKFIDKYRGEKPMYPQLSVIETAADRLKEKQFANSCAIPTADYIAIEDGFDFASLAKFQFPAILKTRNGGFDGRSNITCDTITDVQINWSNEFKKVPCILETKMKFEFECSIAIARNQYRDTAIYPLVKNTHKNGILQKTRVEQIPSGSIMWNIQGHAKKIAAQIAEELDLVGLLIIEMFYKDGKLYFNEMAPRPHNSFHWTIEGCDISQFEMLNRAICNLPLRNPKLLHDNIIMENILYEYTEEEYLKWLSTPYTYLHLYNKKATGKESIGVAPRKIGHITTLIH